MHIKNRWKSLKKSYVLARKKQENGEGNFKTFHYFREMDALFKTHPIYFGAIYDVQKCLEESKYVIPENLADFNDYVVTSESDYLQSFHQHMNTFFEYKRAEFRKRAQEIEMMKMALDKEIKYFEVMEGIKNNWKPRPVSEVEKLKTCNSDCHEIKKE